MTSFASRQKEPARSRTPSVESRSNTQAALIWHHFRTNRAGMFGLITLIFLAVAVTIVPLFLPFTFAQATGAPPFSPAFFTDVNGYFHLFGTDRAGRDEFVRILYGGRTSLVLAAISALGVVVAGLVLGALAGFFGGWIDTLMMRVTDFMLSLPLVPMYVFSVRLIHPGKPEPVDPKLELLRIAGLFVLLGWMGISRLVRGQVLSLRTRPFIEAARALGAGNGRIIFRHLVPNSMSPVLVASTFAVGDFVILEAILAYFSQGIEDFIIPTWGNLAAGAEFYLFYVYDLNPFSEIRAFLLILPVFFIFLTVLSCNYVGDALRQAMDPRNTG